MYFMKFISLALVLIIFTFSCASKPPQQQENICTIFKEKTSWYRLANRSEEKWGAPIHVQSLSVVPCGFSDLPSSLKVSRQIPKMVW